MAPPSPPVFISYSFKDSDWKSRVLGVLKSRGVDVWEDSRLETGDDFDEVIHRATDSARVAVLLITPNYLSSPTIQKEQVPYLLARQSRLRLYPILVETCEWQSFDWLNRLLLFPSDLEPLARTEEARLAPRLALAALEISSFARIPTVPQMVAAKVQGPDGKFEGMATLLRSDVAISTPAGDISDQRPRTLNFALAPSPAEVSVEYRDPTLNICLLHPQESLLLPVPPFTATAPRPGSIWECFAYPSASSPGVFSTGTVTGVAERNGRTYLHLQPSIEIHEARGMSGAPIVVNGSVVGVLESQGAILDEWFAVPLEAILDSPAGQIISTGVFPPQPPAPGPSGGPGAPEPPFDPDSFLARLTAGARQALERAEAYRMALGQSKLHMEHLLLGLYGQPDSPMRRIARDAKVFDESAFRKLLSGANSKLSGELRLAADVKLTSLPPLSAHVRRALAAAQKPGRPAIGRRSLIDGAFSVEDCEVMRVLRSAMPADKKGSGAPGRQQDWLPDVASDVPGEKDEDLLNLERDVHALCSVVAAQDAALPLSIGLFGDWGSGKSFFMKEMEQKLKHLARQGPPTYCSDIVQLKFNAWHYMDTVLWASLTSEIFEGLATALSTSPGAPPENKAAALLADMSSSRDKLADAERRKRDAEAQLAESERKLDQLRNTEAEIGASLSPRVLLTEATRLALDQDEVKTELDKVAKELNLPQAAAAGAEARKELLELRGIWGAMLLAMRHTERLWLWLLALVLVIAAIALLPPLARYYNIKSAIADVTTALASLAGFLAPFLVPARRALKYLQDARRKSDELVRQKKQQLQEALEKERAAKLADVDAQNRSVQEARKKVEDLEQAIEQLRADRQMLDFIQQRNASTDYTSHLGVIARAHKDFRELSAFLERVRKEPRREGLRRVERIVLYIDDLDRCPEKKVMDVLQAVHLLLAFPLFVVVVGVDPRWLLHSVAERSPALRHKGHAAQELWESSPLNYLEKIFQIPFTLSPMTATGFGQLVEKVAGAKAPTAEHARQQERAATAAVGAGAGTPVTETPIKTASEQPTLPPKPAPEQPKTPAKPTPPPPTAEPLTIEPWERELMKQLYCLIPSPRAGKRFINIYRMIRSTIDGAKWDAFVGDKEHGGQHRQALLLLAILTGYPEQAAEILRRLIEREHNETWWEFLDSIPASGEGWTELRTKLQSLRALIPDTEGCDTFREYAPRVARYSFQSGRVLLAQRLPEVDD